MKMLVATKQGQGQRESDFCWTNDGELVNFAFECDTDRRNLDGTCGCRRSMNGLDSGKATTTFTVVEVDVTEAQLVAKLINHYTTRLHLTEKEAAKVAKKEAKDLLKIAASAELGEILEKRGSRICKRKLQKVGGNILAIVR